MANSRARPDSIIPPHIDCGRVASGDLSERAEPMPTLPWERCLTLEEVAELHGMSRRQLRKIICDRQVPVLWFSSRTIRFDRQALEALRDALLPLQTPEDPPALNHLAAPPPAQGRDGWVYFIQSGNNGPIKIGTAINVAQRLKVLQTGHPTQLRLVGFMLGGRPAEQRLHEEYAEHRLSGEWHSPAPNLIQFIRVCGHG